MSGRAVLIVMLGWFLTLLAAPTLVQLAVRALPGLRPLVLPLVLPLILPPVLPLTPLLTTPPASSCALPSPRTCR